MSLYRPSYRDKKTGEKKTQDVRRYHFVYAGRHIQESAKTTSKTKARIAEKAHRDQLVDSYTGARAAIDEPMQRMRTVAAAVDEFVKGYKVTRAEKTYKTAVERGAPVKRILGRLLIADITERRLEEYMEERLADLRARHEEPEEQTGYRTVNMEIAGLARAIGQEWRILWPRLRQLSEPKDTGQALEPEQKTALLDEAAKSTSPYIFVMLQIAFLIGMRLGEISKLRWHQLEFKAATISIGRSQQRSAKASRVKTRGSVRIIPMPEELRPIFEAHAANVGKWLGPVEKDWFVFPFCNTRHPVDPKRHIATINKAWTAIRKTTGVECRFHDLRHTVYTDMLEDAVPDGVIEAGHISPAMKKRYSHVRMDAMRKAVNRNSVGVAKESAKVEKAAAPV